MVILTPEEKRSILLRAQTMSVGNKAAERNCQELLAALMIIKKTLGTQWYQKAMKGYPKQISTIMPTTHNHLLKEDTDPPLTRLLKGGVPSNIVQIIQFAMYIQELSDNTSLQEKIADYVNQERRVDILYSHFTRLLFELKVADVCKRRGLSIHFLPKQKKATPDFEVSSPLGKTYVECKRKDIQVKFSKELNDIYGRIIVGIQNDMSQRNLNYSIKVLLNKEAKTEDIEKAISIAHEGIIQNRDSFKINVGSLTVEGVRLTDYNVIHSSKEIPSVEDEPTLRDSDYYAECNIHPPPIHDFFNLQKSDLPIRNFRVVAVYSPFYASLVESILHSIKDASTQLLESSGHGVIAIEISYDRTIATAEPEVRKVTESIPELLKTMPHIGAVLFFLEEVVDEARKTHRRTRCLRFFNPSTSHKLPADIEHVMATDVSLPHASLLE